mmetsp:Transcript_20227/g.40611  ORF Transcript_20227/g.40611 Transcript_20227/m.40611 type:complete len:211 (+) Transcript_20227:576-1208(+)
MTYGRLTKKVAASVQYSFAIDLAAAIKNSRFSLSSSSSSTSSSLSRASPAVLLPAPPPRFGVGVIPRLHPRCDDDDDDPPFPPLPPPPPLANPLNRVCERDASPFPPPRSGLAARLPGRLRGVSGGTREARTLPPRPWEGSRPPGRAGRAGFPPLVAVASAAVASAGNGVIWRCIHSIAAVSPWECRMSLICCSIGGIGSTSFVASFFPP